MDSERKLSEGGVQPALTAEEWTAIRTAEQWVNEVVLVLKDGSLFTPTAHQCAAIDLHGEPFGFTPEDVATLRALSVSLYKGGISEARTVESLADRIEALLPPDTGEDQK